MSSALGTIRPTIGLPVGKRVRAPPVHSLNRLRTRREGGSRPCFALWRKHTRSCFTQPDGPTIAPRPSRWADRIRRGFAMRLTLARLLVGLAALFVTQFQAEAQRQTATSARGLAAPYEGFREGLRQLGYFDGVI